MIVVMVVRVVVNRTYLIFTVLMLQKNSFNPQNIPVSQAVSLNLETETLRKLYAFTILEGAGNGLQVQDRQKTEKVASFQSTGHSY